MHGGSGRASGQASTRAPPPHLSIILHYCLLAPARAAKACAYCSGAFFAGAAAPASGTAGAAAAKFAANRKVRFAARWACWARLLTRETKEQEAGCRYAPAQRLWAR